jgi:hypothetical protein
LWRYERHPYRLWRDGCGVFSSLKRRGGVPSGAAQVIATELALPEITGIGHFFIGNPQNIFLKALCGYGM